MTGRPNSGTPSWTLTRDGDFLVLTLDLPGESVNVLRHDGMEELEQRLAEAAQATGVVGLLVESGKECGFIAGADIHAIQEVEDEAQGEAAARRGQEVFSRLAALPFPTVALIHGACLGGGLELALACDRRVASHDSRTRLGLPEVLLGILPGFGGTQRLPRLLGLPAALGLLLTGRQVAPRAAKRMGLVDAVGPPEHLRILARGLVTRRPSRHPPLRRLTHALCRLWPIRAWILRQARRQVQRRTGSLFPAPYAVLDAVAAGLGQGGERGYAAEARLLGQLLAGSVSRSLVRLFLLSERAREMPEDRPRIGQLLVAGAGNMGAGIAGWSLAQGLRVRLMDPDPGSLQRGGARILRDMKRKARNAPDPDLALRETRDRLEFTLRLTGLASQDLFLEAVPEVLDLKQRVLRDAEEGLPADALLATNTSSLDLDELGRSLRHPERLVGVHFFHPVHRMRLVEVVRGSRTSEEAVARARQFVRQIGKVPVVVKSGAGFLVNRVLTPYLLQAELLVAQGASPSEVDAEARKAGMPMGPLEVLDEVGLDVAGAVAGTMREAFPDRFQPAGLVQRMVESGALGKKNGRGFYLHGSRRRDNPELAAARAGIARAGTDGPGPRQDWADRMLLPLVAEAWRCLEEAVVQEEDSLDLAMMLGGGVLLADGGPLRYSHRRGLPDLVAGLEQYRRDHGDAFAVPAILRNQTSP